MNELFDLELFFESSPDFVCVAGRDGYFKKINPSVSLTLGYDREKLLAHPFDFFIYSKDKEITAKKMNKLNAGESLVNFDNRYVTRDGQLVWLSWSAILIKGSDLIFGIGKNITYQKKIEEYQRIANIMDNFEFSSRTNIKKIQSTGQEDQPFQDIVMSYADQKWLGQLETIIRKYIGKIEVNLDLLSAELAMSERQLFRRVKTTMGLTPNKYIRIVRFQLAQEALEKDKKHSLLEISRIAGFKTPGYFKKLFKEVYGVDISDVLY